MRGKDVGVSIFKDLRGITPAHAGKRRFGIGGHISTQDHPRPCGEKPGGSISVAAPLGSPPPMRGKVEGDYCQLFLLRITPAHAGKSKVLFQRALPHWDHPRPCGEKRVL